MGSVLLFIQHEKGKVLKATRAAFTAAKALEGAWGLQGTVGVAFGEGAQNAASSLTGLGFSKILVCEDAQYTKYLAGQYAPAIVEALTASSASVFVSAATSTGKDLSARVAGAINAGQASDILAVNADGSLTRALYAGNVIAEVAITTTQKVVTVRPTAFTAAEIVAGAPTATITQFSPSPVSGAGEVLSYEISKGTRPELGDAERVVSGGRALQSSENFSKVIFPLADALGAAVGASRAAVDAGYAPNDWQVGQTGKVVAPQLYIAVGVSGAIQHIAGMKDSKVIVAINKDPDAPIFEVADYGLVADLYEAVPALTDALKTAHGK
jgi:electron transfer flavoprotein alpha subunit